MPLTKLHDTVLYAGLHMYTSNKKQWLTIKYLKLIKLTAGLEVFNSEGDIVARFDFDHPGAGLKMGETVAWWLAHDDTRGSCQYLIHGTSHCWEK